MRASLVDISYRGACLEAAPDLRTNLIHGDEIRMLLRIDDQGESDSVQIKGKVVRIESVAARQTINVIFTEVGTKERKFLTEMILEMAEVKSPARSSTGIGRQ